MAIYRRGTDPDEIIVCDEKECKVFIDAAALPNLPERFEDTCEADCCEDNCGCC